MKNGQCAGQGFAYGVDQQAVLDWIVATADEYGTTVNIVPLPQRLLFWVADLDSGIRHQLGVAVGRSPQPSAGG